ncbi:MAG: hypothetical protein IFK94_06355 [Acidobacteria bacterium]|uniref:Uncharacterized protein n=1 Tax=Candidatus Polarisedimenticola svalbardensis TaxID=2886004 RepID=A0A8J7C2H3_9BACT|nr:hypothetical protein [Candidatus Polarisedimenticola svalbardensis]
MTAPLEPTWYLLDESQAMSFLIVWVVLVLAYGFYRSRGEAKPDPILPSGPSGVLDQEG